MKQHQLQWITGPAAASSETTASAAVCVKEAWLSTNIRIFVVRNQLADRKNSHLIRQIDLQHADRVITEKTGVI